jgi:N-acetylmuramoyl-L-alanine amidase
MRKFHWTLPFFFNAGLAAAASFSLIILLSPRNSHRPFLREIQYIILHTTEGGTEGSLKTLHKDGKIHYMIDHAGKTYRIMEENRLATHAGRSLWNGRPRIDEVSIGIEIVGYHNRPPNNAQITTLARLLDGLQRRYQVPDDRVLTHSQVAYGTPNKWQASNHRGRKRCAMLLATPDLRRRIGLNSEPRKDPDVQARRLAVGDPFLNKVIYGDANDLALSPRMRTALQTIPRNQIVTKVYSGDSSNIISKNRSAWFIARENYDSPKTLYQFPNNGPQLRGDQIKDWSSLPIGTRVTLNNESKGVTTEAEFDKPLTSQFREVVSANVPAISIARNAHNSDTTFYLIPGKPLIDGAELQKTDETTLWNLPAGTKILIGYKKGELITKERTAYRISKESSRPWNSPLTIYRFPDGTVKTGDEINPSQIHEDTLIFLEN